MGLETILPAHILERMDASQRKRLGKAGRLPSELRSSYDAAMEKELQRYCSGLLRLHGVPFINPPMNKRSHLPAGWPDFTFAWRGIPCCWECKTATGVIRPEQHECLAALEKHGWHVAIIRSADEAKEFLRNLEGVA